LVQQIASQAGCALWLVDLDAPVDVLDRATLSADECARADRFIFETHRHRFVMARLALRHVLSQHTGVPEAELHFTYGEHGKPKLTNAPDCRFNMSHSGAVALIAMGADAARPIGVDVEVLREFPDAISMAEQYFDPQERAALSALSGDARTLAFLVGWTRKEACLKALGTGFAAGPMPTTGIVKNCHTVNFPWPDASEMMAEVQSFELASVKAIASIALLTVPPERPSGALAHYLTEAT
jgi:4'-phosphopantetheinyl transferase